MEIDNFVGYPNGTSFGGYTFHLHAKDQWEPCAGLPDVTMEEERVLPCLSIDDVTIHNKEAGRRDWFKYGRKVYSVDQIKTHLKSEMANGDDQGDSEDLDDSNSTIPCSMFNGINFERDYPVYALRKSGLGKAQVQTILNKSIVGTLATVDKYSQLVKFKNWVENVLKGMKTSKRVSKESTAITDFKEQLERWLKDYPCVEYDRYKHPVNCIDNNDDFFPLPASVMCNPLVLRQWAEEWPTFDFQLPEGGAWDMRELLNEDIGDTHEVFAALVKSRVDNTFEDLDTDIDGEAAWNVIETDIVKNDTTTPEQERVWKLRECRTNLRDPEWQRRRRKEIATRMTQRHNLTEDELAPYLSFCDSLAADWKTFQTLCQ